MPSSSRPEPGGLDPARLLRLLPAGRRLATEVEVVARCASTSDLARERLASGELADGRLILAEAQEAGRGRRTRDWWSGPPRSNLALTLDLRVAAAEAPVLGLLGALALLDAMAAWPDMRARTALKWPNDLLLDGAKVAGFLGEAVTAPDGGEHLLLGVGINLNQAPPEGTAPYPTTALASCAGGVAVDRTLFLAAWLWRFEAAWRRLRLAGPGAFEADFLAALRRWAPHGVRESADGPAGPLLEFSLAEGLHWGSEADSIRRPLGWLTALESLHP
ncbi:MAG: biotin--[acetyl-CoA-carboxylase] ligase [Planctomycetota bacterium]|jgi:BirA family biotin operon repressor/biotin-[acetyl-CoA-carboxylase] ligase